MLLQLKGNTMDPGWAGGGSTAGGDFTGHISEQ